MKHIIMNSNWKYSKEPFPAYRCELVYGVNKRDFKFIPIKNLKPIEDENNNIKLPDHQFKVIKTKEKGTIMIVPGNTADDGKCLLFFSIKDGFRGDSGIIEDDTTAQIIKKCEAHNACEGSVHIASVFKKDEKIVVYSNGRHNNDIVIFTWNGEELTQDKMTISEYKVLKENEEENEYEEI